MGGFNHSEKHIVTVPDLPDYLPLIIDDCTLALRIGFTPSKLWFVIHTRDDQHYTQYRIPKKSGSYRILHAPSQILKRMQKNLLHTVIEPLQATLGPHVAAYRPNKSVVDAVRRHIPPCPDCDAREDKTVTLPAHNCPRAGTYINLDVKNFFPSTSVAHVRNYLKSVGYSHEVAGLMSNLMVVRSKPNPHYRKNKNAPSKLSEVPQGAPTSGAICNLVADKLIDGPILEYLQAKNRDMGLEDENRRWVYTRYADDLALTCGIQMSVPEIKRTIADLRQIIHKSGYKINPKKTRYMYGTYYRKSLLGMVFTDHPNYAQTEYRKLRAVIHNCSTSGFESQYTRAGKESAEHLKSWLLGVIQWIHQVNPAKADNLLAAYNVAIAKDAEP